MSGASTLAPSSVRPEGAAITIADLNKYFGKLHVLKGISLDVRWGEKIVLCGPSGSGKSTLIRCINQLERHQSGLLTVDGIDLRGGAADLTRLRREVGMVFQHFNLFPHMTVLENCMLAPMRVRRVSRAEAEDTARALLDKIRILDQAQKYPGQLSGGQQQRVAIARALCIKPKIMLFDEPTSALDPEMVKEVLDTMVSLASEGMTMICVTHEMGFARKVADRIAFMADGRIVETADPEAFFRAPQTPRAREFLDQILH
jgi:ABC-type polar amino acid transport system ATPase subunit